MMHFRRNLNQKKTVSPLPHSSQSGFAHLLLIGILLIGLGIGVYLIQQKTNIFSHASNPDIDQLTTQLESLVSGSDRSAQSEGAVGSMLAIASERRDKLLDELNKDPQSFLKDARLADKYNQFPDAVKPYIEQNQQIQGTLSFIHVDKFNDRQSYTRSEERRVGKEC